MNNRLRALACLAIVSIIVSGCSDKTNPTVGTEPPEFTTDKFPMEVGNKWVYTVRDTILGTTDTIQVLAFDTTTLFNGEFANVWLYVDTGYTVHIDFVSVVGDTVKFYRDRSGEPSRIFVFPIEVGKGWGLWKGYGVDTSVVIAKESVSVPYGEFEAYLIDTELMPLPLDMIEGSMVWVSPDVGMARMEYFRGFRVLEEFEIWELIDFLPAN